MYPYIQKWLNNTRIRGKLIIFISIPVIVILFFGTYSAVEKYKIYADSKKQHNFVSIVKKLDNLIFQMQQERGLSSGLIGSKSAFFIEEIVSQRELTDKALRNYRQQLDNTEIVFTNEAIDQGFFNLNKQLEKLADIRAAVDAFDNSDPIEYYSFFNTLAVNLIQYLQQSAHDYKLNRLGSAYFNLLWLRERAGQERAELKRIFASRQISSRSFRRLISYIESQEILLQNYEIIVPQAYQGVLEQKLLHQVGENVNDFREAAINKVIRNELLNELQTFIGYGGVIHYFKNYVIRGDQVHLDELLYKNKQLQDLFRRFKRVPGITEEDLSHLQAIEETFAEYFQKIDTVKILLQQGTAIQEIDANVRVDDTRALQSISYLRTGLAGKDPAVWWDNSTKRIILIKEVGDQVITDIRDQVVQIMWLAQRDLLIFIGVTLIALALSFVLGALLMRRMVVELMSISQSMRSMYIKRQFDQSLPVTGNDEIGIMARTFNQLINELKSRENRISTLVDTIVDGIVVIDAKGNIQSANPAALALFGYTMQEMLGKNVKMLMPEPYASKHDGYLNNYLSTGEKKIIGTGREVTGRRKDGTLFPMELAVGEMKIDGEHMFTGIVRDVTERKRLEQLKSEFISTVSHELRTPLTSIRGALGLLAGKAAKHLPENARHLLEMAERNSERLTLLINDILDLEKIETGRLTFSFTDVNLCDLAARAVEDNTGYADKHQVKLVLSCEVEQALVRADENRLLQVFANLISNAVKYSPTNGTVTVSIVTKEDKFCVAVRDHGSGIPSEFRNRIFHRFAQANSSDTRSKGGTGLGLSISKAIIERHEGEIGYKSEQGMGTVFYFRLPGAQAAQRRRREDRQQNMPSFIGVRALICESDPDIAQNLNEILLNKGLTCDVASTAVMAKKMLAEHNYRLLLVDLALPDADGLTFMRELFGNTALKNLPAIVLSDHALEECALFNGNAVKVIDWIQKPFNTERLTQALQRALRRNKCPLVLHVEDDVDIVEMMRVLLEDIADLTSVNNLHEARKQLATHIFDLVILDIDLPDGSGAELFKELYGRCPVVIFSGLMPSAEVAARANVTLTKSMTSNNELLDTIKNILNLKDTAA